jgi:hypothetical protein
MILFCRHRRTFLRKKRIPEALEDISSSAFSWGSGFPKCLRRIASSTSSSKQLHKIELLIVLLSDVKNILIALMIDFTSDKGIRFLSYDACQIVEMTR